MKIKSQCIDFPMTFHSVKKNIYILTLRAQDSDMTDAIFHISIYADKSGNVSQNLPCCIAQPFPWSCRALKKFLFF